MERQIVSTTQSQPLRSSPIEREFRLEGVGDRKRASNVPSTTSGSSAAQAVIADAMGKVVSLSFLQGRHGRCLVPDLAELDRAFGNPAAVFEAPEDVLRHPLLTIDSKREILWRWAWDEYLIELASAEGMANGEPSCLPEVQAALHVLNHARSPDPAAPAAFAFDYRQDPTVHAA